MNNSHNKSEERPNRAANWTRRDFFHLLASGFFSPLMAKFRAERWRPTKILNDLFWVRDIPDDPFYNPNSLNLHLGVDSLLYLMAEKGLKFYCSSNAHFLAGPKDSLLPMMWS